jgi:hypothetical protein
MELTIAIKRSRNNSTPFWIDRALETWEYASFKRNSKLTFLSLKLVPYFLG